MSEDLEMVTRMNILRTPDAVFESFVDPARIGKFWFSSSSDRWDAGKAVTVVHKEYGAEFDIKIVEAERNRRIVFLWDEGNDERKVTLEFDRHCNIGTSVTITESGWGADPDVDELLQNKEGWVFMLTCLKAYLENGVGTLRTGLIMKSVCELEKL